MTNSQEISAAITETEETLHEIQDWPAMPQLDCLGGKELFDVIETLLSDVRRLCKSNHLKIYFSKEDRDTLKSNIANIGVYATRGANNSSNVIQMKNCINGIREVVRSYWIRGTNSGLRDKLAEVEGKLMDSDDLLRRQKLVNELNQSCENLMKKCEERLSLVEDLYKGADDDVGDIGVNKENAEELLVEIRGFVESVKGKKETVEVFSNSVESSQEFLENVDGKVEVLSSSVDEIKSKYAEDKEGFDKSLAAQREVLDGYINSAREALGLNTALGLSSHFQSEADKIKPCVGLRFKKEFPWLKPGENASALWIVASVFFVFLSIAVFAFSSQNVDWGWFKWEAPVEWHHVLATRVSFFGICVAAAIYCARHYSKMNNIYHEYAFRKAVSASMPGLMEQLVFDVEDAGSNDSVRATYVKTLIEALHKNPLSNATVKTDAKEGVDETLEIIGKVAEILKSSKD